MVSEISSNAAQMHGQRSLAGVGGRATGPAKLIGAAAVIMVLSSPLTFAETTGNSQRMAQEQHACAVVMGLHRPGDLYDTCIRSLDHSLSQVDQARLASTHQRACAHEGFKTGTPAYAICVVNAEQSTTGAAAYQATVPVR